MHSSACWVNYVKLEAESFSFIPFEIATGLGAFGEAHVTLGGARRALTLGADPARGAGEGPTTFRFLNGPMDKTKDFGGLAGLI